MKIAICTFAFLASHELLRMVRGAQSTRHDVWIYLSLHSTRPDVIRVCGTICQQYRTQYFPYGYNRGLARSLNDAMLFAWAEGADVVINCNDDVTWGEGDVDRLAEAAMDQRQYYAVSASGWHGGRPERDSMGYCVIAFNPISLSRIGCFDENFFPAYFEDVDHHRRAKLAGLLEGHCEQTGCYHEGSLSLSLDHEFRIENDRSFQLNQRYWQRKWGPAGAEYGTPFDAGGEVRIAPEDRRAPYGPGRDRDDLVAQPLED